MRWLAVVGFALCGCAPAIKPAPAVPPDMMAQVRAMQDAQRQAEASCGPLRTTEPNATEERVIGTLLAAQELENLDGGSLFLDPSVEGERSRVLEELGKGTLQSLPEGPKGSVTAHVAEVGQKLAKVSPRPELPWVFGVVKSEAQRTFSEPGGFVFITTGLLKKVSNEAQLAGLLGHEMGHVVKKHQLHAYRDARVQLCVASKQMSVMAAMLPPEQAQALQFKDRFVVPLEVGPDDDFARWLAFATTSIISSSRSKQQELDADRVALELLGSTDFAAAEFETIVASLPKESFAPEPGERVQKLKGLREGELKPFLKGKAKADLTRAFAPLK